MDEYYRRSYGKLRLWRECKSFCFDKRRFSLNQEAPTSTSGGMFTWCSKQTVPVYVSSYELPDMFECVAEFEHRSIKCATKNSKVTERLFLYKK